MFKFLNLQPEVFGMEINDLTLRLVSLKHRRKGFDIVSFNEVDLDPGIVKEGIIQNQEALVKAIKVALNTVHGKKIDTRYVAVSLPEEKAFSQVIQMPRMSEVELKSAVPYEAENYIPLTIDKIYLDFQIINPHNKDNENHLDLLINVMPKPIVDSYVTCFKGAGLIPYIFEIESQSITRALINNEMEHSPLILIDLGVASTSFVIFADNSVRFTASIPISSESLTQAISDGLKISFDEAEAIKRRYGLTSVGEKKYNISKFTKPILMNLSSQIKKYINFYQTHSYHEYLLSGKESDKRIAKIVLCGGGANLKMLNNFLEVELKIPVVLGDPFINIFENGNKDNKIIPQKNVLAFATVLGLALRGVNDKENR